jgi:hypothetical protein
VEAKPIPGVAPIRAPSGPRVASNDEDEATTSSARPSILTKRSLDVLMRVERRLEEALRASDPSASAGEPARDVSASESTGAVRRN